MRRHIAPSVGIRRSTARLLGSAMFFGVMSFGCPHSANAEVHTVWTGNSAARKLGPEDRKSPAIYDSSQVKNPVVTISFPFSVSPVAHTVLNSGYENVWIGFHCEMGAMLCSPLPGAMDASLVHTRYWLPYLYHELQVRMPGVTILLEPIAVDITAAGSLSYLPAFVPIPTEITADFYTFTTPGIIEGRWQRPRTRGDNIAPALITSFESPGKTEPTIFSVPEDLKLQAKSVGIPSVLLSLKFGSVVPTSLVPPAKVIPFWDYRFTPPQWAELRSKSAADLSDRGDAIKVAAAQIVHAVLASGAQSEDVRLALYSGVLGVKTPSNERQQRCLSSIYKANIRFDASQSEALLDILEAPEARTEMMVQLNSENTDIKADAHNAFVSGIGTVAVGMLGNPIAAATKDNATLNAATANKAAPLAVYNAKVKAVDVQIGNDISHINAVSEADLRAAMKRLYQTKC